VTDHLTGLGNRRHLFDVLDAFFVEQAAGAHSQSRMAFLFIDLNHFKEINDSFGHPAGDEILRQLGARLGETLRASAVLARVGGDEFAAVLMDADADHAATIAGRLTASLEEPFVLDAMETRLGASIGIALAPTDATDTPGLMWCADVAMYRAKWGSTPFALYEPNFDDGGNRLRLADELRAAIDNGQLVLHYQPLLDLRGGSVSANAPPGETPGARRPSRSTSRQPIYSIQHSPS
jgi:diguanylate cyclase (GGDEF)-like protein